MFHALVIVELAENQCLCSKRKHRHRQQKDLIQGLESLHKEETKKQFKKHRNLQEEMLKVLLK